MSRQVKSKKLKVISVCSICGEPVCATTKDNAYRHGFNRHKVAIVGIRDRSVKFSQEDGSSCSGSGQPVVYKRKTK